MKVGLIARTEDRGLGNLTWEWAQHMHPDRVLVVVPNHPLPQRADRYPGALVLPWDHLHDSALNEEQVREWLRGLDVVYSAETFYDWRVCTWARELGVRTVCHVMPEFYRHGQPDPPPAPDAWWTPTRWRLEHLDPATRVVPVPIATERFTESVFRNPGPPRWLHVVGKRAGADRNGTRLFLGALRFLRSEHHVRIRTQDEGVRPGLGLGRDVHLETITTPTPEYWQLYDDADALVLPRRYAGLSLPAFEAMGAGLALVMSDAEPQRGEWPIIPIPAHEHGSVLTPAGRLKLAEIEPRHLARVMDRIADQPDVLAVEQRRAKLFAFAHSWEQLAPTIRAELERVAALDPTGPTERS